MRSMIKVLAAFALVVGSFSQYGSVGAADNYKFKGLGAEAYFYVQDPAACVTTSVAVFASEYVFQNGEPGRRATERIFLDIYKFDICTNTPLMSASGEAPLNDADFIVDGNLSAASLHSIVTVYDFISNTSFDMQVDLDWSAISSKISEMGHYQRSFEGCRLKVSNNHTFRYASVTGTVSDGAVNFTPVPSVGGNISTSKGGDFLHGCE